MEHIFLVQPKEETMDVSNVNRSKSARKNSLLLQDGVFEVEFFGYSFSLLGVEKKVYVKAPMVLQNCGKRTISLSVEELNLVSSALRNTFISSFRSERFSLFDISFRTAGLSSSIGFNFNDIMDFYYIEPEQIFKPFENYGVGFISNVIKKLQASMFQYPPGYNPVFMFGLVISGSADLECVKGFIRYDPAEAPTALDRASIIERIAKPINPKGSGAKLFTDVANELECIGFEFAFVGVDCYINGSVRIKLYFRCYGKYDLNETVEKISSMISQFGLSGRVEDCFSQHHSGIWGIALSTDLFEDVNRVQLYFYP